MQQRTTVLRFGYRINNRVPAYWALSPGIRAAYRLCRLYRRTIVSANTPSSIDAQRRTLRADHQRNGRQVKRAPVEHEVAAKLFVYIKIKTI